MFLADARMSLAILALVALVAYLIDGAIVAPLIAGWILLGGAVLLLVVSALSAAAKSRK